MSDLPHPFISEPNMTGVFTREEADGAIPNGARIRKIREETGDTTPLGTLGWVLGSLAADDEVIDMIPVTELREHTKFAYFVEWDILPHHAIGIIGGKIEAVDA